MEEVHAEITDGGDRNIDFDTLSAWWRQREAKKWTSTMSFFVVYLCVALTPLLAHVLHFNHVPASCNLYNVVECCQANRVPWCRHHNHYYEHLKGRGAAACFLLYHGDTRWTAGCTQVCRR